MVVNNGGERVIRKVAILGAGASADAGAPTIGNFFEKVDELIKSSKFTISETQIFKDVLLKREKLLPNSTIEEFLSFVDFQIHFSVILNTPKFVKDINRKIFHKDIPNFIPTCLELQQRGYKKEDILKLKKDISLLISRTLDETLRNTNEEITHAYQRIMSTSEVTISFNWDILFEHSYRLLKGKSLSEKQLGFDDRGIELPALLKMHGSFNWGLCEKCGLNVMDSKIEHKIHGAGENCLWCNEQKLHPVSILPALNKFKYLVETEIPPYKHIWHCAMYAITEAEEIYFFGYSLSDADAHAKIFFKAGITQNTSPNLKIYVVYKPQKGRDSNPDLEKRYIDTFKPKVEPKFIRCSFREYFSKIAHDLAL